MPTAQIHKINSAALLIDFKRIEEGFGLQENLSAYFYEKIEPQLAKILDAHCDPEYSLKIDQITLDCGTIGSKNWEKELLEKIKEQLAEELKSRQHLKIPALSEKKLHAEEVFLYYLKTGHFPWNSTFHSPKELESQIDLSAELVSNFATLIDSYPQASKRFFHSFTETFQHLFWKWLLKNSDPLGENLFARLFQIGNSNFVLKSSVLKVLVYLRLERLVPTFRNLLSESIESYPREQLTFLIKALEAMVLVEEEVSESIKTCLEEIETPDNKNNRNMGLFWEFIKNSKIEVLSSLIEPAWLKREILKEEIDVLQKPGANETLISEKSHNPEFPKTHDPDFDEAIFIENAGLVILHPFISQLFESLGMINKNIFVSSNAQQMGTVILETLVYGDHNHAENLFPLNKILCGISPDEVLEFPFQLPENHVMAVEELLREIIQHWKVLKNTSVEGLRETFLQRMGKLSKVNDGWKLQVEKKSLDILMGSLPWGIGVIKLPWMNTMLFVEWN